MVVAFMTALSAEGLGLSSPVDRALRSPEQIRSVHCQSYGSLNEHEYRVDMGLGLVPFTIIRRTIFWRFSISGGRVPWTLGK